MAVETRSFTCVQCPMGCPLTVTLDAGKVVSVEGNGCPRGRVYGEHEATHPERVVTSLVGVEGDWHPLSVKTASPVPRERIDDVLDVIADTVVPVPVRIGDVLIADVAGTGVSVIATQSRG